MLSAVQQLTTSWRPQLSSRTPAAALFFAALMGTALPLAAQSSSDGHAKRNSVTIANLEGTDFSGAPFSTDQLDGKIVLLDFWATWCSPCLEAFPSLKQLENELGGDDFQVVSVALYSGKGEDLQWVVDKYDLTHALVVGDDEVPITFDLLGFPTYLLMGRDGNLIRRYVGDFNDPVARIRKDVVALLNGKSILVKGGP